MFKKKQKYDDYIIEYYIVETMRFFFGFPPILFYPLRVDWELRDILNLKVQKSFANYEDFRKKLHKLKVRINSIIKRNVEGKSDELYGLDYCCNSRFKQA